MNLLNLKKYLKKIKRKPHDPLSYLNGTISSMRWVFNNKGQFTRIRCVYGPEVFCLIYGTRSQYFVLTNNEFKVYGSLDKHFNTREESLNYSTQDEYFNYSIMYPDLPTIEELKVLREYLKKNYKNKTINLIV